MFVYREADLQRVAVDLVAVSTHETMSTRESSCQKWPPGHFQETAVFHTLCRFPYTHTAAFHTLGRFPYMRPISLHGMRKQKQPMRRASRLCASSNTAYISVELGRWSNTSAGQYQFCLPPGSSLLRGPGHEYT